MDVAHDLRRVIGDEVIETVVGRGYRLIANVVHVDDAGSALPLSSPRHAWLLKQVADVPDAVDTTAIVVLIVGDASFHETQATELSRKAAEGHLSR